MEEMIDLIVRAYVSVCGLDKWLSLTQEEQHDVVETLARDAIRALDKIEAHLQNSTPGGAV